ncbi:MAG: chalcone isomerase family protein [Proteobacteria bacterium]|nr:chalcone isomerase family protein [Pseudomonadota bacterium]
MKRLILLVIAGLMMVSTAYAEGKAMPDTMKAGDADLLLNGSGVRTKLFMDLYVAGLYVPEKTKDVVALLKKDDKMAMRLQIISKLITSEKMSEATREGFEKSTHGNIAPIQKEIDDMISVFSAEIKQDDVYDMVYVPGTGTNIIKNGVLAKTIPGEEFSKALFGIWIGDNPVQEKLKSGLAGS